MQESIDAFNDSDYLLIAALQVAPRADWQSIGAALGIDGTTAARRWSRLEKAGVAWLSCRPAQIEGRSAHAALIEVDCEPSQLHEVARTIGNDRHVLNLEQVTGGRNLIVMAIFTDLAQFARYRDFRLADIPGVTGSRAQLLTVLHSDASRWRVDRLDEVKLNRLTQGGKPRSEYLPARAVTNRDLPLARAVSDNPRASLAELAKETGLSPATVRRRLAAFEAEQALLYRVEVARVVSGWPIGVHLWCRTAPSDTARIGREFAQLRETRICGELTGPDNLLLAVWLRSIVDLANFEKRIGERFPEVTIADRAVTLWPVKLGAHLLDPHGRHLRGVPLRMWDDTEYVARQQEAVSRLATEPGADAVAL
jgi:DNA-binding Lrp family transcriptional regulator